MFINNMKKYKILFVVETDQWTFSSTIWQIQHNYKRLGLVSSNHEVRKLWIFTHFLCINYLHNISDAFSKSHNFPLSIMLYSTCYFMYMVYYVLWIFISITRLSFLFSHINYHMSWIIFHLPSFVFPIILLLLGCLALLCLCVYKCMSVSVSVCVCVCVCACDACWHGIPEEEGRPRRRRTPRFLLKPWTHPYRPQKVGWASR